MKMLIVYIAMTLSKMREPTKERNNQKQTVQILLTTTLPIRGFSSLFTTQSLYQASSKRTISLRGKQIIRTSRMTSFHEEVEFKTLDGLTLRGWLYPTKGHSPAVIMTPGVSKHKRFCCTNSFC